MQQEILESIVKDFNFEAFETQLKTFGFQEIKNKPEVERRKIIDSGFLFAKENRIYTYSAKDCSELYLPAKYYFRPKTIEQLQTIVKTGCVFNIPVTFASGKTGLSAGYANFAAIIDMDSVHFKEPLIQPDFAQAELTASQDVLISDLIKYVPKYSNNMFIFPIQPSSAFKLPVRVGGMIGSNASGVTSGKLGACESWIKKMTIMTPNGEIREINNEKHPEWVEKIIGKNGYFGVVLKATFALYPQPSNLQNKVIIGTEIPSAFNKLQEIQDKNIFPLNSEYVMSKNGLLGKLGALSERNKVNWAVLIRGTQIEVDQFTNIMVHKNNIGDIEVRAVNDSDFREYLEERTNQALLAENATSDLAIVKFPGFEDILAPPSQLSRIMEDVNAILKKYGFEEITIAYGHLNFRKGKGLLLHSRIPVPIEMLAYKRKDTLNILATVIVETNLMLRDKYHIRAKEEHSGGAFGIWFDPAFRTLLQHAIANKEAFANPHLILFNKYNEMYPELSESEVLQKLACFYLQNS